MLFKNKIKKKVEEVLKKISLDKNEVEIEPTTDFKFGDYTTTIALKLSKKLKKNPYLIAQEISQTISLPEVEKKEIIKPGYINFWLSKDFLINLAYHFAIDKWSFPSFHFGPLKKIMIEFAQPNTHKLFHIGHLRNICLGESLSRIFEVLDNYVIRTNYQGDVGMHIAKCLYQIKNQKSKIKSLNTLKDRIEFIGKMYTLGNLAYEENSTAKKEIIEINKQIYEQHPKIAFLWQKTRKWSLDYFDKIYKRLNTRFDRLYFESEMTKRALEICQNLLKRGILEKSEGALVFNGKKYNLDTRVFVNSLGFPTYEGKELSLAEKEFSDFGDLDKCIHIVTPEQKSFFQVTFKVEELINPKKFKDKQYHLAYEWVNLKTGKMSSRQGNIVEAGWLIDEAKKRIKKNFSLDDKTTETLAIAAIKYSFLKNGTNLAINFDFDESISLEGNSGIYLLYTYVRANSVLKKIVNNLDAKIKKVVSLSNEEDCLLRSFVYFPEVTFQSGKSLSPNILANYLYHLAKKFNLFYQKHRILDSEIEKQRLRILLTKTTAKILKKGLSLLGIKTVEKM